MDANENTTKRAVLALDNLSETGALYLQYPRQTRPQDCYVEIDLESGEVSADANPEIGNAVPSRVWHGLVQRIEIPLYKGPALARALAANQAALDRIVAGGSSQWDGSNKIGKLTADAEAALEELGERLTDANESQLFDADDL